MKRSATRPSRRFVRVPARGNLLYAQRANLRLAPPSPRPRLARPRPPLALALALALALPSPSPLTLALALPSPGKHHRGDHEVDRGSGRSAARAAGEQLDHTERRDVGMHADAAGGRLRDSTARFFCTPQQMPHRQARQQTLEDGLTTTKRTSTVIGVGLNPAAEIKSIGVRNFTESVYATAGAPTWTRGQRWAEPTSPRRRRRMLQQVLRTLRAHARKTWRWWPRL